jgi:hypothetical protein
VHRAIADLFHAWAAQIVAQFQVLGRPPKLTAVIVAGESHDGEGTVCQTMRQPVSVSLDLTAETGNVAYRPLRSGECVAHTRHVNDVVKADFDVDLLMLGIQLLRLDDATIAVAQRFAEEHNHAIPSDLTRGG